MEFCDFLKHLRRSCGYTQQNIADLLEINRSTYAYYECGKTEPAIRHLKKLSQLYNLHMEDLVCCRYNPTTINLAQPDCSNLEALEGFRTLNTTEQNLIMVYRSMEDKEAFLRYIRAYDCDQEKSDQ